jgi:predicted cobalt transporter CbtA
MAAFRRLVWLALIAGSLAGGALFLLQHWTVLPHVIGAPTHPDGSAAVVPPDLARRFAFAVIATNAVFWLLLGGLIGVLAHWAERIGGAATPPRVPAPAHPPAAPRAPRSPPPP